MTDSQTLLADYIQTGSDAAFRELVTRYVDLAYSTALRLVEGDTHLAKDVAQTVFIDLARMARGLSSGVMLGGWEHRHTCFVAANILRGERRRQFRERQAVEMNVLQNNSSSDFSLIAPILDEAINELAEADRTAVLLRFFEQRDFRSVGEALGTTEDAARMRATRALDKLQSLLKRRGVTTSAGALSAGMLANAIQAAPVGLAVTISSAATLAGSTITGTATATATKAIAMTTLQKTLVTATVAVLAGAGIYESRQASQLRDQVQTLQQQQAPLTKQIHQLQQERDDATNQLAALRAEKEKAPDNTAELLRLRGMAGVARRASAEAEQLREQLARQASAAANNPMVDVMKQAMEQQKQTMEQQMEVRLARMTASLHLTPEQVQAAREILMRQAGVTSVGAEQLLSGKYDKEEFERLVKQAGNPDAQIKALLTPEQQALTSPDF